MFVGLTEEWLSVNLWVCELDYESENIYFVGSQLSACLAFKQIWVFNCLMKDNNKKKLEQFILI